MYKVKYIEHTADLGFQITANKLPDLFQGTILQLYQYIINIKKIRSCMIKKFIVEASDMNELLYTSLKTCLDYYFQIGFVGKEVTEISMSHNKLEITLKGENIDIHDQKIKKYLQYDIKAITYHQLEIKQIQGKYTTNVIIDI